MIEHTLTARRAWASLTAVVTEVDTELRKADAFLLASPIKAAAVSTCQTMRLKRAFTCMPRDAGAQPDQNSHWQPCL